MTDAERLQFVDLIEMLHLTYPEGTYAWRGKLEAVVSIWANALGDLPGDMVAEAVRRWVLTEPKLPHISDIRGVIQQAVDPLPSEGEAWSEGLDWVRGWEPASDPFGVYVMKCLGKRRELGQMDAMKLRETFAWEYRRRVEAERTERTASVGELTGPSPLRAIS